MSGFNFVRTPLQLLGELASVLTGQDKLPGLLAEMVRNKNVNPDNIQMVLAMHKVPQATIDLIQQRYQGEKAAAGQQ